MEIFQTIWTALTTENTLLSNIVILPITFLESFINVLIFTTLLNINISKKRRNIYIIFISILLHISDFIFPNPYKSFINLIGIILSIHLLLKVSILKSILAAVIPIFATVLCESLLFKIFTYYFTFDAYIIVTIPICRIFITLGIEISLFIVYLLIKYFKFQIKIFENMSSKNKRIFLFNIVLALFTIAIQFLINGFYLSRLPIYIVLFSNLTLIAYFLLSIYSLTKTTQLELTSLNLEQEKENNKILKDMQDELHGFRHDFSNIMCTIGGYVQVNDMDGLSKYYSEIQKDVIKLNNLGALNSEVINNPAVFILISSKYSKALELGIEMNINIFLDLNTLNMKIYEFTRILGILLDNSIEAAKECDKKIINLEIRKDSKRNRQLLIVENTYSDKNIDTEKIFEKKYSTKDGNSGLGLWEVRQILRKNSNLNLFTSKNETFFKQQLEIYNI